MNAKLFLMTALLGGASILSAAACSSSDDNKPATNTTTDAGNDSGSTTADSGSTGPTCDDSQCGKICTQATKAACGDSATIQKYVDACQQALSAKALLTQCADKIDAAETCFGSATFVCQSGTTTTTDCQTEFTAAQDCVQAALGGGDGGTSDGGTDDGGAGDGG